MATEFSPAEFVKGKLAKYGVELSAKELAKMIRGFNRDSRDQGRKGAATLLVWTIKGLATGRCDCCRGKIDGVPLMTLEGREYCSAACYNRGEI